MYEIKYDDSFNGAALVARIDGASLRTIGSGSGYSHELKQGDAVILTGFYVEDHGYIYAQTTFGDWYAVLYPEQEKNSEVWAYKQHAEKVKRYSENDAQAVVDALIRNNRHITEQNLFCARYISKLTKDQRKLVCDLQKRVAARNNALKNDAYIKSYQEGASDGYAELSPYLDKLMTTDGVGIATWAICVIVAVVIGAAAGAAYFVYRDWFDESKEDVKYSDELTKVLMDKLTDEEYQQLMDETQGIVTKARLREAASSSWDGIKSVAKYIAIAAGCLLAIKAFSSSSK